jgi:hypothetical protein
MGVEQTRRNPGGIFTHSRRISESLAKVFQHKATLEVGSDKQALSAVFV